jgi:hypothetical protein
MALAIARNASASDHLVHGWSLGTFGDDIEIACAADEVVVLCPAFAVGETLGPGRHRWRNPDVSRPAAAYFVLTSSVEVPFDMVTRFMMPATREPISLRVSGAVMVRCAEPAVLVAQFVGLPVDDINGGLLRSVATSVERLAARLLIAQIIAAGGPAAVVGPEHEARLIEQLGVYGPTAGAVFGIDLARLLRLNVSVEGAAAAPVAPRGRPSETRQGFSEAAAAVPRRAERDDRTEPLGVPALGALGLAPPGLAIAVGRRPTQPGAQPATFPSLAPPPPVAPVGPPKVAPATFFATEAASSPALSLASKPTVELGQGEAPAIGLMMAGTAERAAAVAVPSTPASAAPTEPIAAPRSRTESLTTLVPPIAGPATEVMSTTAVRAAVADVDADPPGERTGPGAMMVGMGRIGAAAVGPAGSVTEAVVGTIEPRRSGADEAFARGERVLVAGADGRLVAATVRDRQAGYYQLEIGGTGETAWVPEHTVVAG